MYPLGHFGTALLFIAPVAALLDSREQTGITVYALFAAWLPDLDKHVAGLTHHGLTHTVAFGVVVGTAVGAAAAGCLLVARRATGSTGTPSGSDRGLAERFDPGRVFALVGLGLFLGVVSHVTADVLVLLPGSQPVSPLWPVSGRTFRVEFVEIGAPVRNGGLFVLGAVAHAVVSWRTATAESDELSLV